LDTGEFRGDEADTYRDKVSDDLPPRLDTTSQAWLVVSAALKTYAGQLEDLQSRMATLKARADEQGEKVDAAQATLSSAQSADKAHTQARQDAAGKLKPGESLPADTYHGQASGASSSLSSARQALQDTIDAAATVRSEHTQAVDACCREIDRAKGMRFADPPGFWGKLSQSVGDWISEHADVLKSISSVLKTISGIAGMLALIPCLAPIMGPIALVTGGVALVIDVGVKLATGDGSWLQIGVDALGMIPGVRAAKAAFGANVALTSYNVATGNASVADLAMVVGLGALGMRGHGSEPGRPGEPPSTGAPRTSEPVDIGMPTHVRTVDTNGVVQNRMLLPTRPGETVRVQTGSGSVIEAGSTPGGHTITVSNSGPDSFSTTVPDGSNVHFGDGSAPPAAPRTPSADLPVNRSQQPYASNGVRVSRDPGQNQLASTVVNDMQTSNMNPRVDQGQVTSSGMTTNRPDVAGVLNPTTDAQPVHVELDKLNPNGSPGARVAGHVATILGHDPGSIVITIPSP